MARKKKERVSIVNAPPKRDHSGLVVLCGMIVVIGLVTLFLLAARSIGLESRQEKAAEAAAAAQTPMETLTVTIDFSACGADVRSGYLVEQPPQAAADAAFTAPYTFTGGLSDGDTGLCTLTYSYPAAEPPETLYLSAPLLYAPAKQGFTCTLADAPAAQTDWIAVSEVKTYAPGNYQYTVEIPFTLTTDDFPGGATLNVGGREYTCVVNSLLGSADAPALFTSGQFNFTVSAENDAALDAAVLRVERLQRIAAPELTVTCDLDGVEVRVLDTIGTP